MRGAPRMFDMHSVHLGIIPADAGSTLSCRQRHRAPWDHPRGCGEHPCPSATSAPCRGSSPRMRGAQRIILAIVDPGRIIPADAGSTVPKPRKSNLKGDHPRGCGEHPRHLQWFIPCLGSSPRMRGAPSRRMVWSSRTRIIPADAGSTRSLKTQPS